MSCPGLDARLGCWHAEWGRRTASAVGSNI
jgi:hypothetical protein